MLVFFVTLVGTIYVYPQLLVNHIEIIPFHSVTKKTSNRDAFSFVISSQLGDDLVLKFREGRKEDRSDHFVPATHFKFKTLHRKFYFFWLFQIQQNYFDVPIFSSFIQIIFLQKKLQKFTRGGCCGLALVCICQFLLFRRRK